MSRGDFERRLARLESQLRPGCGCSYNSLGYRIAIVHGGPDPAVAEAEAAAIQARWDACPARHADEPLLVIRRHFTTVTRERCNAK